MKSVPRLRAVQVIFASIALETADRQFKRPDGPRTWMVRGHRHFGGRHAGREDWMADGGPRVSAFDRSAALWLSFTLDP